MKCLEQQCLRIFLNITECLGLLLKLLLQVSSHLLFLLQALGQCILQVDERQDGTQYDTSGLTASMPP